MNKLKKYIIENCITQHKFAKKIGISPNALINILKGSNFPRIPTAYEIEKVTKGEVTVYDWTRTDYEVDENIKNINSENQNKYGEWKTVRIQEI